MELSEYVGAKDKAKEWGICWERVLKYLNENRVKGAVKMSNRWFIPRDSPKPPDKRLLENKLNHS